MIGAIFGAFITSKPLQWALMALVALGGYEGWKYHERSLGAAKLEQKITQKADADVAKADAARDATPSARGPDDPSRLR